MNLFRRLFDRFTSSGRRFGATGVRPMGPHSMLVVIGERSYWVQARMVAPQEYRVGTSDVRDITSAATVVAAPPAPERVVPEVRKRLEEYFRQSRTTATYY